MRNANIKRIKGLVWILYFSIELTFSPFFLILVYAEASDYPAWNGEGNVVIYCSEIPSLPQPQSSTTLSETNPSLIPGEFSPSGLESSPGSPESVPVDRGTSAQAEPTPAPESMLSPPPGSQETQTAPQTGPPLSNSWIFKCTWRGR